MLEIIVCSVEDAIAAEAGGADRLEVISHYEVGGLTPPVEMVKEIAARVKIPLRVMVRESEPFEVFDDLEIERLCEAASKFAKVGVDGLVLGFLLYGERGNILDLNLLDRVLLSAPRLKATFHRAIEELPNPAYAIEQLKSYPQIDRVLTSGGGKAWRDKVRDFAMLREKAQPEIEILVGGGTDAEVIRLLKPAGIREFHVGKAVRQGQRIDGVVLAEKVREMKTLIEQ